MNPVKEILLSMYFLSFEYLYTEYRNKIVDISQVVREGLKKKGKKRDGFIQCSSDPSQPGIGMDKKNSKFY